MNFVRCLFGIELARGGPARRESLLDCPAFCCFEGLTFLAWEGSVATFCGSLL